MENSIPLRDWGSYSVRKTESLIEWADRIRGDLLKEIKQKRETGISEQRLLLVLPRDMLRLIWAVTFCLPVGEADQAMAVEFQKRGFIHLYGLVVVSNDAVTLPGVKVLEEPNLSTSGF